MKNGIYDEFDVSVLDKSMEGILWVRISGIHNFAINICVCYLHVPPEESSRRVNPHDFYDTLISQIYQYQDNGNMNFICGDFNGRLWGGG